MKSILLVTADAPRRESLEAVLTNAGWAAVRVEDRQEALRAAADRAPDLLLVDARVAGAANLLQTFGSRAGGPGALVLAPPDEPISTQLEDAADEVLPLGVEDGALEAALRRVLETPRTPLPTSKASPEKRLTSTEVFGDVLRSVESGSTSLVDVARPSQAAAVDDAIADAAALFETTTIPPLSIELPEREESPPEEEAEATPAAEPAAPSPASQPPSPSGDSSRSPFLSEAPPEAANAPSVDEGRSFGQFRLTERIAIGGMAEVWKADMQGMEGFRKTVAIKKILPHLTESEDFVTMFIDEAKLAAQLSHENILDIYDLGRIDEDYFIAMEYVDGRDLRSLLNAVRARQAKLPLGLSLLIASRLARALEHAHWRRDADGQLLSLVHRDVSPRNVLVSYDGIVKLCDFGVAKAATQVAKTQGGALKGKLQYMSPEQARGEAVDARSDIFSLGALLFEMVTGEELFAAENEMSLLDTVRACRVREPKRVDPSLPDEVNRIIARALRSSPARRYQSAGEMLEEIDDFLRSLRPQPTDEDLASYLEEFFPDEAPSRAPAAAQTRVAPAALFERDEKPDEVTGTAIGRSMKSPLRLWPIGEIAAVVVAGAALIAAVVYLLSRFVGGG